MQESELAIRLTDGKESRGTLWEVDPSGPLVIMIHGGTSDRNSSPFPVGARQLAAAGQSTFRPDLYSGGDNGRSLLECDVDLHASDVSDIVSHLREAFPKRPLIGLGHSLGGMTLLASNIRLDALVLLDPSHSEAFEFTKQDALAGRIDDEWTKWNPTLGCYTAGHGMQVLASAQYYATMKRDSNADIEGVTEPLLIIVASNGILQRTSNEYLQQAPEPKELVTIEGADHCFDAAGAAEQAFGHIAAWVSSLEPS